MTGGGHANTLKSNGFLGPESDLTRAILAFDWAHTGLGSIDGWPTELRTAISLIMGSAIPSAIWWGPHLKLIHNQHYQDQLLGDLGPRFGHKFDTVGADVAGLERNQLSEILQSGRGATIIDQRLDVHRGGRLTETYWNHNLSPILDADGSVLGVHEVSRETTSFVFRNRADELLIALDDRLLTATSVDAMIGEAVTLLGRSLATQRAGFAEIDLTANCTLVHPCWSDGTVTDLAGRYPVGTFAAIAPRLAAGEVVLIEDGVAGEDASVSQNPGIDPKLLLRAALIVPIVDRGNYVGAVFVQDGRPRRWLPYEIELAKAATARLWYAIIRLRAETARTASEARYRLIFEQANDIIFTADVDQRITDCNEAGAAAMGLTRDEIIGRSISEFVSPKDFEQTTSMLHHKIDHGGNTRHEVTVVGRDGVHMQWENNSTLVVDSDNRPLGLLSISRDVTARRAFDERRELLIHELNHRVKNTLALVQALAQQSFRPDADVAGAPANFEGRLRTLAAAHDLLTRDQWEGVTMAELVRAATTPLSTDRITSRGDAMTLTPKAAVALAMAIHELGTNAIKYGSLSCDDGQVDIIWTRQPAGFAVEWREHGGPSVVTPERRGFGVRMIERVLASDIGGAVTMNFAPDGLQCRIDAPLTGNVT